MERLTSCLCGCLCLLSPLFGCAMPCVVLPRRRGHSWWDNLTKGGDSQGGHQPSRTNHTGTPPKPPASASASTSALRSHKNPKCHRSPSIHRHRSPSASSAASSASAAASTAQQSPAPSRSRSRRRRRSSSAASHDSSNSKAHRRRRVGNRTRGQQPPSPSSAWSRASCSSNTLTDDDDKGQGDRRRSSPPQRAPSPSPLPRLGLRAGGDRGGVAPVTLVFTLDSSDSDNDSDNDIDNNSGAENSDSGSYKRSTVVSQEHSFVARGDTSSELAPGDVSPSVPVIPLGLSSSGSDNEEQSDDEGRRLSVQHSSGGSDRNSDGGSDTSEFVEVLSIQAAGKQRIGTFVAARVLRSPHHLLPCFVAVVWLAVSSLGFACCWSCTRRSRLFWMVHVLPTLCC